MPRVKPKHHLKLYKGRGQQKQKVTKVLRDLDVLKMRENGMTYERIAEEMKKNGQDISPASCAEIVKRLITNILENSKESIENVREMELRRLDGLLETANKIMKNGRAKAFIRLQAMDRVLRISERRAKLEGLDVQRKTVEHKGEVGIRVYHGIETPPELLQIEASAPTEAEFEMLESPESEDNND